MQRYLTYNYRTNGSQQTPSFNYDIHYMYDTDDTDEEPYIDYPDDESYDYEYSDDMQSYLEYQREH